LDQTPELLCELHFKKKPVAQGVQRSFDGVATSVFQTLLYNSHDNQLRKPWTCKLLLLNVPDGFFGYPKYAS